MSRNTRTADKLRNGTIGVVLTVLVSWCLWKFPIGDGLVHLSYDLAFAFAPVTNLSEVIIIKMDEASAKDLKQGWGKGQLWDRTLHAKLLDKLRQDGCRLVVFDVFFGDEPNLPPQADAELARAIKAHGHVLLAAVPDTLTFPGVVNAGVISLPKDELLAAAATNWGVTDIKGDADSAVRIHSRGTELYPSLPWVAARLAGAAITKTSAHDAERWIRYYGPNGTFPYVSYYFALSKAPGYFRDKIVFVGGKPLTLNLGEVSDMHRTPYTRWDGQQTPGVELNATMFLNLVHNDWLTRLSGPKELLVLLAAGLLFGFGFTLVRPKLGAGLAILCFLGVGSASVLLVWETHVWFSWMVIAAVQIPCALAWSVLSYTKVLFSEIQVLETQLARVSSKQEGQPTLRLASPDGNRPTPSVPDHRLVRRVGKGAFGEVWLAQNAIGTYHAVKIVFRQDFKDNESYVREFRGIQKYMPISLNHLGLLHVLQVGRNDAAGYYFCVMEIADDETAGPRIDPNTYAPRTLGRELHKRGKIPAEECVSIGLALTEALDFLHKQELIHRDIKPSNIIFVGGVPKLADIGLVTDIAGKGKDVSYGGTEGYIAPEGPGTAAADMYGLGKVMYEASMGRDRLQFPELPSTITTRSDVPVLLRLNTIILKACETDVTRRYQSAAEMRADLLDLQTRFALPQKP